MRTINSMPEYLYLIDEALFDAGDLLISVGDEGGAPDGDLSFAKQLETQLSELQQSVTDGSYAFADQDLPFMEMVRSLGPQIPFGELLLLINHTHRNGLGG